MVLINRLLVIPALLRFLAGRAVPSRWTREAIWAGLASAAATLMVQTAAAVAVIASGRVSNAREA